MKRALVAPRSPYSDAFVARAKALLRVCTAKGVSRLMDVPLPLVAQWRRGERRAQVPADEQFLRTIERLARLR